MSGHSSGSPPTAPSSFARSDRAPRPVTTPEERLQQAVASLALQSRHAPQANGWGIIPFGLADSDYLSARAVRTRRALVGRLVWPESPIADMEPSFVTLPYYAQDIDRWTVRYAFYTHVLEEDELPLSRASLLDQIERNIGPGERTIHFPRLSHLLQHVDVTYPPSDFNDLHQLTSQRLRLRGRPQSDSVRIGPLFNANELIIQMLDRAPNDCEVCVVTQAFRDMVDPHATVVSVWATDSSSMPPRRSQNTGHYFALVRFNEASESVPLERIRALPTYVIINDEQCSVWYPSHDS